MPRTSSYEPIRRRQDTAGIAGERRRRPTPTAQALPARLLRLNPAANTSVAATRAKISAANCRNVPPASEPAQAAAAVANLATDLGPGYVDVLESQDNLVIGDESRTFSYRYEGDSTGAVQGHLISSRLGDIVVNLQVDGPDELAVAGVHALANAQVSCLASHEPCAPMPALRALTDLVMD